MRSPASRMAWLALWLLGCGVAGSGCQAPEAPSSEVAVEVGRLAIDPESETPVLILEEIGGPRWLPIWIGFSEARAIAAELNDERPARPGTHDLAKRLIDRLAGRVTRVVVTKLDEGVYYAVLSVRTPRGTSEIDSRPSDAIAIALRTDAPLFVHEALLDRDGLDRDGLDRDGPDRDRPDRDAPQPTEAGESLGI